MSEDTRETVASDNIVGRLYNIIYEFNNIYGKNSQEAFKEVFSLDESDKSRIVYSYAELFKMCTLGINEIEKLNPKNANKYISTLNNVIEGLSKIHFDKVSNSVNDGLDRFHSHFNSELMISLEYCADYLSEHSDESKIEDEKIKELIKEIEELINNILDYKLGSDLEKILICQLNNVRDSLLKYKLFGSEGILNSISTAVGTFILNREVVNNEKSTPIMEKIFGVLGKINTIISIKNNSVAIFENIYKRIAGDN
jgi:hypothetical protein